MKLIRQPKGSHVCGQACVAMIVGCSLEEATAEMGQGRTATKKVREFLKARSWRVGDRLIRLCSRLPTLRGSALEPMWDCSNAPPYAILKLVWNNEQRTSHWVAWCRATGFFYDPARGLHRAVPPEASSYLWVMPPVKL